MMTKRTLSFILCAIIVSATGLFAQSDPLGEVDTLAVISASAPRGGQVAVDVYLSNDEALHGVSVPIRFKTEYLDCDSVIFNGGRMEHIELKQFSISDDSGYVLFGGIVLPEEEPIAIGQGTLATLLFSIDLDAPAGLETIVDTGFVPPAGEVVLTGPNAEEIFPAFRSGTITVSSDNYPPVINVLPKQYVVEGDTLSFKVAAYDREKDQFNLIASRLPQGAEFDQETRMFSWSPDYVGASSSSGNPFEVIFVASDGHSASNLKVEIEVINKNREPSLSMLDSYVGDAGDTVEVLVSADDPDFEDVDIAVSNLPSGATYDGGNPGMIQWVSSIADSGIYNIEIEVADPNGALVQETLGLTLNAVAACDLMIEEHQVYIDQTQIVAINLFNRVPISSMQLLIKYDPTAVDLIGLSKQGTRMEDWERFQISRDDFAGRIWVNARADLPEGDDNAPLEPGQGDLLYMNFKVTSDLSFGGILVPVEFEFLDDLEDSDNTFEDKNGEMIGQDQISYANGSIFIKLYDGLIGDINANGIAFEIADAIYFTNHFIDATTYPLDGEKWQNSDVNQDNRPGTLGDLVYLIRIITGDAEPLGKLMANYGELSGGLKLTNENSLLSVQTDWDLELGAALLQFNAPGSEPRIKATERTRDVDIHTSYENEIFTVLICDSEGKSIRAGDQPLVHIEYDAGREIELTHAQLSDVDGRVIMARIGSLKSIPEQFELGQNYPNPFNPTTTISFGLPSTDDVSLRIYNIRGQLVRELVNGVLDAGYHEVTWDGQDQHGGKVASGIYFYRLESGDYSQSRKMIMLK